MARLIKKDRGNYTNVSNTLIRDKRLSWKARGIFIYLWSQANEWQFYVSEIATHATDGERALRSGIKELETYGYLKRVHSHSDSGSFDGMDWVLSDHHAQNSNDAEMNENPPKKVQNTSGAKRIRCETHSMQDGTLRNNNIKKYQYKEISIERNKNNSSTKVEPPIPYQQIIDYLNRKTGAHYKTSSKANQRLIKARFKEGYKLDDFKTVIDNKAFEWQHTDMWQFMRPSTLFSPSHFDDYLNANNLDKHKNKPTGGGYDSTQVDLSNVNDDDLPF